MQVGGGVVHHSKMALVLIEVIQFERLVSKAQPKALVSIRSERLNRAQKDYVANVKLNSRSDIFSVEEYWTFEILLTDLRPTNGEAKDLIQAVCDMSVETSSQIPRLDDPVVALSPKQKNLVTLKTVRVVALLLLLR